MISYDGKVLLIRRKIDPFKNEWWFPGGRVYKNEKLEKAAVRKAYEEASLKVSVDKKVGAYETMFETGPYNNLNNGVHTINVCFLVRPVDKGLRVKIDETSFDYKWIGKIEDNLNPYIKNALRDAGVFN